jgi:hypothetical protein
MKLVLRVSVAGVGGPIDGAVPVPSLRAGEPGAEG